MAHALNVLFIVLLILWATVTRSAQDVTCSGAPLAPGTWAQVIDGDPHNLRASPSLAAERVGGLPPDDIFRVTGAARCADGYRWHSVLYAGSVGWLADAPEGIGWYRPLDGQSLAAAVPGDPVGCAAPPDDYQRFWVKSYAQVNLRTLAMLDHAQVLYDAGGGLGIRLRAAVMQGSYNDGYVAASFGTHDGGGAVDIAVRDLQTRQVLEREIEPALLALRTAGFAAWLRSADELYVGSVIHIHAIAVGDAELSDAARAQVSGEYGYFRGYNGLPPEWGGPALDPLPAVTCAWMQGDAASATSARPTAGP